MKSLIRAGDVRMGFAIIAVIFLLAVLPLALSDAALHYTFSEEGPFEQLSIAAWLFASFIILMRIRPLGLRAWAFFLLFACFAAREADWHKAFTADSILKSNYYRHAVAPLSEKIAAFIVAVAFIALVIYAGIVIFRFLFLQRGWRSRAGFWLLLGTVLVVLGKMLDRAPAVLHEEYGVMLLPIVGQYAGVFEEGLEMLHPFMLAWSIWISQSEKSYLVVSNKPMELAHI